MSGIVLLTVLLINIGIGLIVDSKETGFRGFVSFLIAQLLLRGQIKIVQIVIVGAILVVGFAGYAQYRTHLQERYLTTQRSFNSLEDNIGKAFSGERSFQEVFQKGFRYFMTRTSINGSTEMVTANAGRSVPFKSGATLTPVFYVLIPRFILPDKPDSNIGQMINREFMVSWSPDTYISIGQVAEFYWNFKIRVS